MDIQTWGRNIHDPGFRQLRADTGGVLFSSTLGGLGLAVLPAWLAHDACRRGELEAVLTDYEVQMSLGDQSLYLVYAHRRWPQRLRRSSNSLSGCSSQGEAALFWMRVARQRPFDGVTIFAFAAMDPCQAGASTVCFDSLEFLHHCMNTTRDRSTLMDNMTFRLERAELASDAEIVAGLALQLRAGASQRPGRRGRQPVSG